MAIGETFGMILAAAFTLMVLSFVFKDSFLYKIAEKTLIGASAGQFAALSWARLATYGKAVSEGHFSYLVAILFFAPVLFLVFYPRISWMARYAVTLLMGLGVGLTAAQLIDTQIWKLLRANILPLNFDNLVIMVALFTTLTYFIFYKPLRVGTTGQIFGPLGIIGRYFMMIAFGATWGSLMLGYFTMVYDRLVTIIELLPL